MSLQPGTTLGPYEVVAEIGRGGMGEVYRARDTKLDRDVALKVLPEAFTADPDRLARFEREAKVLASLNHPNIAAIYGLEESEGMTALVMELVDGDDLSQRIAHGAIPLDDALPIATQIAEALEAAHEQGVIHRDLKPANVKVKADGTVKVLDFGLAKAMEPVGAMSASGSMSPTITSPAMTQAGMILGTAAYMSPEQARGKTVDKRADIWAFGVVLSEMLTGRRAFAGEDVSDTLATVLKSEPEWDALPPDTPPSVRRVVQACLRKDAKQRVHDVADVRLAMEGAFETTVEVPASVEPHRKSQGRLLSLLPWALAVGMAVIAIGLWNRAQPVVSKVTRYSVSTPPRGTWPDVVSPDGRVIAFSTIPGSELFVRRLDQLEAAPLRGAEGTRPLGSHRTVSGCW